MSSCFSQAQTFTMASKMRMGTKSSPIRQSCGRYPWRGTDQWKSWCLCHARQVGFGLWVDYWGDTAYFTPTQFGMAAFYAKLLASRFV